MRSLRTTSIDEAAEVAPTAVRRKGKTGYGGALVLTADPQAPCGVSAFTERLAATLQRRARLKTNTFRIDRTWLSLRSLCKSLGSSHSLVCNLPLVAWKRVPLKPLLAMALARLRDRRVVIILHEWGGLNWLRRLTYRPALMMAHRIVMFSPLVRQELADDRWIGNRATSVTFAPLPPNLARPSVTEPTEFSRQLAAAQEAGRIVIGVFGSIYPGKQPQAVLSIATELKSRGYDPLIAYIGDFVRATDNVEERFRQHVTALKLEDNVAVSGYVESDAQLYQIFSRIDVFVYRFSEGTTARRSSILAALQSGRPVITTEPADPHEFDHHPRFADLIRRQALTLVSRRASPEQLADRVMSVRKLPTRANPIDTDAWWNDLAAVVEKQLQ